MGDVRAFFAVELGASLDEAAQRGIETLRERAGEGARGLRFVRTESLHVTLRFLGDVSVERLGELVAAVQKELASTPAFPLSLGGLVGFPNPQRPRVLAFEAFPAKALSRAAAAVERGVVAAGLPAEERPFRPHLTLARVRGGAPSLEGIDASGAEPCEVREVVLLQSELGPEGARYTPLERLPLGGRDSNEPRL